ncbi:MULTISPECIES: type II toxin-antitoxin system YafQ family toxin [Helicobacter]|uniref:Type II toxin-antitoxin system YafQ family toxin n=2 Tax=Helicobacter typhlonius TaxID=76936 RepID=A0A099UCF3_9HELI|nr:MULTISPECIES: type II toxin-antitoxin system YafQ family toxin [Helicobacter]TLD78101.1 type II toxin-antitoxin system YafQ family toxin [Helicobacter typhlonius]TLD86219.1 type II toxin-antitoxin system YafQ family toxin [Helicobacter sp. MIT 03-1616]CUU39598.1 YafQ toxin protein [Helicobacter typhlonius]
MKYKIAYSKQYKNAVKKLNKEDLSLVENLLNRLANDETLEPKYKDHKLKGSLKGLRECHIKPNLVLIYDKIEDLLILKAINVGSHSEVF